MVLRLKSSMKNIYRTFFNMSVLGGIILCGGCSSDSVRMAKISKKSHDTPRQQWASRSKTPKELLPPVPIGGYGEESSSDASFESDSVNSDLTSPPSLPESQRFFALPQSHKLTKSEVKQESLSTPIMVPSSTQKEGAPISLNTDSQTEGWTSKGGTWIVTSKGDTLKKLSERYGVPKATLENMNALPQEASLKPGTHIIIPVYQSAFSEREHKKAEMRVVSASPKHFTSEFQETALTKSKPATLKMPDRARTLVSQGERRDSVLPQEEAPPKVKGAPIETGTLKKEQDTLSVTPAPSVSAAVPPVSAGAPSPLRWPVRGRVITHFNVGGNEGINIAVPSGTPVKAAEDGVVAYAGEELKGYGKLILIRHSNGLISAYAHNSNLLVNKGDKVRRGQNISLSGQTGSVNSPQLHFEVRQGAIPVDPIPRLENNTP